jgi:Na+-transporting NADH:ubiquinone oxidoreductase subunit D
MSGSTAGRRPDAMLILSLCPALAVTHSLAPSLALGAAMLFVLPLASLLAGAIGTRAPRAIRRLALLTIAATLVMLVDQFMLAYAFELRRQLSIFLGLIVVNCLVLERGERHAVRTPPLQALKEGLAHGLAFAVLLSFIGAVRELAGAGSLLGRPLLPQGLGLVLLAPGALFLAGLICWLMQALRRVAPAWPGGIDK